jgi:hypothetical protein
MNSSTFRGITTRCNHARMRMMHFVQNLQYYLMFEVLESSWTTFSDDLQRAVDLDSVIASHSKYLDRMLVGALLGEDPKAEDHKGSARDGSPNASRSVRPLFNKLGQIFDTVRALPPS